jgi:hypothetical protein
MIDRYSAVEQSQPWRYATMLALKPFATTIYSRREMQSEGTGTHDVRQFHQFHQFNMVDIHSIMLRLLQDDDETIRSGAAEIVREGLRLKHGVSQKRAMELVFEFIESCIAGSDDLAYLIAVIWKPIVPADFSTLFLCESQSKLTPRL